LKGTARNKINFIFIVVQKRRPKEFILLERRWFRYCFRGHRYCLPSAIGEACAPWVLFGDILYCWLESLNL